MSVVDAIIKVRKPQPRVPVIDVISKRFSPRVFSAESISQELIERIFEAARLTPSARNIQPWFFYGVKKNTTPFEKMKHCIPERNGWALKAPFIVIACYNPNGLDGLKNNWAQYDLGAAVMSLVLQAQELGIYARQIGSFDAKETKSQFDIQDPLIPFTLIAMGKQGSEEDYQNASKEYVDKDLIPPVRKATIYNELI